jgi:hypothetical protein
MKIKHLTGLTPGQMIAEGYGRFHSRDAYQRDYDNSQTGFGRRPREDDEYVNGEEDEVRAYNQHMDSPHDVHINGKKWKTFGSHGHASNVAKKIKGATVHKSLEESATAGATSSANIGTVDSPAISPGKARGKKSYTGSVKTGSGTKAPPQPVVKQPKKKDGTAVNGLDIKGSSLFGGPANEAAVIKRR